MGIETFAANWPHLWVIGRILDVSSSGLSFWYLAREKATTTSSSLMISSADGTFDQRNFPVETVWDESRESDFHWGDISMRVCGLKFAHLSDDQKDAIHHFINAYCTTKKLPEAQNEINTVLLTGFGGKNARQAAGTSHIPYFEKDHMRQFWNFLASIGKKGMHVLLVDDETEFLGTLSERMRLKGFVPLVASSGKEAIEIAQKHHVHAAVVDLNMPDMDGLETIRKLKEIRLHTN